MEPQSLTVPTLPAGAGLELRAWRIADTGVLREAAADPYIPLVTTVPAEYDDAAGRAFVERQWAKAGRGSGYPFVIVDAAEQRPVGFVGLWPKEDGRASLGYWTVGSARGRGVAGNGLRAVSRWAFEELRLARLELYIEPWNTGSVRTAERAGFRREGRLRQWRTVGGERRDMDVYALLATDPVDGESAEGRGVVQALAGPRRHLATPVPPGATG
ncbi:GNAT family N-acetyltransferase [Kitasatospora sp. RG8]|uniref:GNAT family N-acetyltransferase n=1 Tax=Kitasatospora sp. RG8 TaxID=2820815 RepID=UPI001ADFFC9E|nr:GNAT family N-acetyltransferase [Kitasatospora sp. RG8]MBP0448014.1 GNAT family N-acetyltransferase [Kitasatospora sp. RG8]